MALKNQVIAYAILTAFTAASAHAQEETKEKAPEGQEQFFGGTIDANVGLTSDYIFRGISQTDENPALQGGFKYERELVQRASLYLGVWGSNVDFNDGDEAALELDGYGGVMFDAGPLALDLGVIYYAYPGADSSLDYDFVEYQLKAGHDFGFADVNASINYSPDFFAGSGSATYLQTNAAIPLIEALALNLHAGRQTISDNTRFGLPDYTDWSLGFGYHYSGLDFALAYTDTDIGKNECSDACDARVVLTVSKSF